jgi:hypothetical protein
MLRSLVACMLLAPAALLAQAKPHEVPSPTVVAV